MNRFIVMCAVLVIALTAIYCGKKTTVPNVVSSELQTEIDRITPLVYWCDGQASGSWPNNIDHRPNCDVGDGAAESGFLTLVGQFKNELSIFNALANSFGPDGQPFRAPSYVGKDNQDEFSRDQLLGFIQATVAGLDKKHLRMIIDYYHNTGKLCPHPTDTRCTPTPGVLILAKYALGDNVTDVEKITEAAETKIEASTVPMTYRADLVMKKIYTMAKMNRLTSTHARSAKIIYNKAPNNLWFKTVYLVTNKGTPDQFAEVAHDLAVCMKQWKEPGRDWEWSQGNSGCGTVKSLGHEMLAVAHLLLNVQPIPVTENNDDKVDTLKVDYIP